MIVLSAAYVALIWLTYYRQFSLLGSSFGMFYMEVINSGSLSINVLRRINASAWSNWCKLTPEVVETFDQFQQRLHQSLSIFFCLLICLVQPLFTPDLVFCVATGATCVS